MTKIDLHIHSNHSDGDFSPKQLVDFVLEKGIPAMSITDHDTATANHEAESYAKDKGIEYIPGIEITKNKINMINKQLVDFILEARKRGFSDFEIKKVLIDNKWEERIIDEAFKEINLTNLKKSNIKNQVCIFISDDILSVLEKRAKKNLMNLEEQIQDILRRSCVRKKTTIQQEKIDDLLVSCFSRQRKGKK